MTAARPSIREAARQYGIVLSETVVIGNRVLAVNNAGRLMLWHGGQWRFLSIARTMPGKAYRPHRRSTENFTHIDTRPAHAPAP